MPAFARLNLGFNELKVSLFRMKNKQGRKDIQPYACDDIEFCNSPHDSIDMNIIILGTHCSTISCGVWKLWLIDNLWLTLKFDLSWCTVMGRNFKAGKLIQPFGSILDHVLKSIGRIAVGAKEDLLDWIKDNYLLASSKTCIACDGAMNWQDRSDISDMVTGTLQY